MNAQRGIEGKLVSQLTVTEPADKGVSVPRGGCRLLRGSARGDRLRFDRASAVGNKGDDRLDCFPFGIKSHIGGDPFVKGKGKGGAGLVSVPAHKDLVVFFGGYRGNFVFLQNGGRPVCERCATVCFEFDGINNKLPFGIQGEIPLDLGVKFKGNRQLSVAEPAAEGIPVPRGRKRLFRFGAVCHHQIGYGAAAVRHKGECRLDGDPFGIQNEVADHKLGVKIEFARIRSIAVPALQHIALAIQRRGRNGGGAADPNQGRHCQVGDNGVEDNIAGRDRGQQHRFLHGPGRNGDGDRQLIRDIGRNSDVPVFVHGHVFAVRAEAHRVFCCAGRDNIKGDAEGVPRLDLDKLALLVIGIGLDGDILNIGWGHGGLDPIVLGERGQRLLPVLAEMRLERRGTLAGIRAARVDQLPDGIERVRILDACNHGVGIQGFLPIGVMIEK